MSSTFPAFHAEHEWQPYTPVFHACLEAKIADTSLPVHERVDAWVLRMAWGNHSRACVDSWDKGKLQIRSDCARALGVSRQLVSTVIQDRVQAGYYHVEGRAIIPISDPQAGKPRRPDPPINPPGGGSKPPFKLFVSSVYSQEFPDDYLAFQAEERRYKEHLQRILNRYKKWRLKQDCQLHVGQSAPADSADCQLHVGQSAPADSADCQLHAGHSVVHVSDRLSTDVGTNASPILIPLNGKLKPNSGASSSDSYGPVAEALARYGTPDDDAARQLLSRCRAQAPDATPAEVAEGIHRKGLLAAGKNSPIGFLLTVVPKLFEGEGLLRIRAELEARERARLEHRKVDWQAREAERERERAEQRAAEEARRRELERLREAREARRREEETMREAELNSPAVLERTIGRLLETRAATERKYGPAAAARLCDAEIEAVRERLERATALAGRVASGAAS